MPQLVKKRRSGWAVLAAGALVASLLSVGAAPAGADQIKAGDDNKALQDVTPVYSACVGGALGDAGFTDLGSLVAAARDINCLASYGITTGKTATTFDPSSNVTRSQMALFLSRAAKAAGVDLMGGKMSAEFSDVSELGEDRQAAIKSLARNGILAGRGGGMFAPSEDITRAEMAVALVSLLRKASPGLFDAYGALKNAKGQTLSAQTGLDYFADARGSQPVAVDTAISYAFELGITNGYPDATFRPNDGVPRRNMASFIMRTLAHTNLRPAGITAQHGPNGALVSVRTADFAPVPNVSVDAFKAKTNRAGDVFTTSGACSRLPDTPQGVNGFRTCTIDSGDYATDAAGNMIVSPAIAANETLWVWTGAMNATVGAGTALYELAGVTPPVVADELSVSVGLPKHAKAVADCAGDDNCYMARYGVVVTYTLQLKGDHDGNPATPKVNAGPPRGGAEYTATVTYQSGIVTVTDYKVDSDGKATFSVTYADPDPRPGVPNTSSVSVVITPKSGPTTVSAVPMVRFSDAASAVTTVTASSDPNYTVVPARGSTTNRVTAAVYDQYGHGMSGIRVAVDTNGSAANGVDNETARYTTAGGQTGLNATRQATQGNGPQMLSVVQDSKPKVTTSVTAGVSSADLTIYWVNEPAQGVDVSGRVVAGDASAGVLVIDDETLDAKGVRGGPTLVRFDAGDQFEAEDGSAGYGMTAFVKYVSADDDLTGKANGISRTVTVRGYNSRDSKVIAGLGAGSVPVPPAPPDTNDLAPNRYKLTDDLPENNDGKIKYGVAVTYTLQLANHGDHDNNNETNDTTVDAGRGDIRKVRLGVPLGGGIVENYTADVGPDGKATITGVVVREPNSSLDESPDTEVSLTVTYLNAANGTVTIAEATEDGNTAYGAVTFSEKAPEATTVKASASGNYKLIDAAASTAEKIDIVATVYDQYGATMSGVPLRLEESSQQAQTGTTGSNGKVTLQATNGTSVSPGILTTTVNVTTTGNTSASDNVVVYWVMLPTDTDDDDTADNITTAGVVAGDLAKGELVLLISGTDYRLVKFDSNDKYTVPGSDPNTMAGFAKYIGTDADFGGASANARTVTVTGYKLKDGKSDPAGTSNWTAS